MTSIMSQWIGETILRDNSLVQILVMAASAVITWYAIQWIPWERVRNLARFAYLAGGVAMYLLTYLLLPRGG